MDNSVGGNSSDTLSSLESLCRQLVSSQASVVLTTSDNLHKVATAARYYGKLRLVIIVQTGEEEEEEREEGKNVEVETVRYVELISSPVSSWPAEAELRPYYLQYPALLPQPQASRESLEVRGELPGDLEQLVFMPFWILGSPLAEQRRGRGGQNTAL